MDGIEAFYERCLMTKVSRTARSRMRRMKKGDRVLQQVRRRCLSLPENHEVASWGHPNFRAGVWADGALDWGLVGRLLEQSYRMVALKRMIAALDGTK